MPSRTPSPSQALPSGQVVPFSVPLAGNPKPSAMTTTRQSFLAGPPPGMVTEPTHAPDPRSKSPVVIVIVNAFRADMPVFPSDSRCLRVQPKRVTAIDPAHG